jgi:hypothetical protein
LKNYFKSKVKSNSKIQFGWNASKLVHRNLDPRPQSKVRLRLQLFLIIKKTSDGNLLLVGQRWHNLLHSWDQNEVKTCNRNHFNDNECFFNNMLQVA